jgi:hypothetical protein
MMVTGAVLSLQVRVIFRVAGICPNLESRFLPVALTLTVSLVVVPAFVLWRALAIVTSLPQPTAPSASPVMVSLSALSFSTW